MFHSVFADEDSEFGQLYYFRPANYYKYNDKGKPSKAEAFPLEWPDDPSSSGNPATFGGDFSLLLEKIEDLIQAWYGSSDLYQINGVLIRAFKDVPRQEIPHFIEGDTFNAVVDRAFLMQIMNATILPVDIGTCNITQEPTSQNYVIWTPHAPTALDADWNPSNIPTAHVLRVFENDVTGDDNMEMTRLVNFVTQDGPKKVYVNCGSELVTDIVIYVYNTEDSSLMSYEIDNNTIYFDQQDPHHIINTMNKICAIMPFRYIPCIYVCAKSDNVTVFSGMLGDVYNWMVYNKQDWEMLNFVAYQSLWTPKNIKQTF